MNDTPPPVEQESFWDHHRFLLLIGLAIVVALVLVSVSLVVYNKSGAAQLDLSRPGYQSVASQAQDTSTSFKSYSATGPINSATIGEFQSLYSDQTANVNTVDSFGGDPLNIDTLEASSSSD